MRFNSIDDFVKYYKEVNNIPYKQISKKRIDFWHKVDKELKNRISGKPVFFHGPAIIAESNKYILHSIKGTKIPHVEVGVYGKKYYSFVLVQVPEEDRYFYRRRRTLSEIVMRAKEAEKVYVNAIKIPMKMFSLKHLIKNEKDVSVYVGTIQIDRQMYKFEIDNARIFASTKIIPYFMKDNPTASLLYDNKVPKHVM